MNLLIIHQAINLISFYFCMHNFLSVSLGYFVKLSYYKRETLSRVVTDCKYSFEENFSKTVIDKFIKIPFFTEINSLP